MWCMDRASSELCVADCCACLASERMVYNCKRSKRIAEVLLLFAVYFQQIPSPPLCLQSEKLPPIPVRCAQAALDGLLQPAGCATAHLYRCEKTSALCSPACDTPPPSFVPWQPRQPFPTEYVQKGFSSLVNADKSVLAGPHFFAFFRAFKIIHDYLPCYFPHY